MSSADHSEIPSQGRTEPSEFLDDRYFDSFNYADRKRSRFSMYWFARRYYAALVRRHAPPSASTLLELGCGLGDLLGCLQDDFESTGVDLIGRAVEESRIRAPGATVVQHDLNDLSIFDDDSFDVVVSLHVVEHLGDPRSTIESVARVLRPGGLFLFATPNPDYRMRRHKDPELDAIGKDPTHINVLAPHTWRSFVEASGFEVRRHFGDGLWDVPYWRRIPSSIQFAVLGLPALVQVLTRTTFIPLRSGVNQVCIARLTAPVSGPQKRSR